MNHRQRGYEGFQRLLFYLHRANCSYNIYNRLHDSEIEWKTSSQTHEFCKNVSDVMLLTSQEKFPFTFKMDILFKVKQYFILKPLFILYKAQVHVWSTVFTFGIVRLNTNSKL